MSAIVPSFLDSGALARRLGELVGSERNVQVEFLLHLDEFDRRRAYLEAGFGSLWEYCLRRLHLREGAAGRRIGAMRVLRRFPMLEPALRDGRLCLSTASLLGQVLTGENLEELVARAAYGTKAEVEHLVAAIQPRTAPKDGVRKLPTRNVDTAASLLSYGGRAAASPLVPPSAPAAPALARSAIELPSPPVPRTTAARPRPPEVRPVSETEWSIRVTFDAAANEELETLKALLSHKIPRGDLAAVLREAIRCGIEKHGKRKGATPPSRERASRSNGAACTGGISAAARREVWKRDGGTCCWTSDEGHRCGSRWQLEVDHILPLLKGGTSEPENLRILCRLCRERHKRHYADSDLMPRARVDALSPWHFRPCDAA